MDSLKLRFAFTFVSGLVRGIECVEAIVLEAGHVDALLADNLFTDPSLHGLALEHIEVGVEVLVGYHILDIVDDKVILDHLASRPGHKLRASGQGTKDAELDEDGSSWRKLCEELAQEVIGCGVDACVSVCHD